MGGYTFDYPLFLWLNFDGGVVMDNLMLAASKPVAWAWLYILILYMVWRRDGWRGVALFVVAAAVAVGIRIHKISDWAIGEVLPPKPRAFSGN